MARIFEFLGSVTLFGLRVIANAFRPPFELQEVWYHLGEVGARSVSLVAAAGLALGVVMTAHTRSILVTFGAEAKIPVLQSLSFFVEIGPLVTALLVAGRVGASIGAMLANMRTNEQIDAIEALSIDSFKFLVVPQVIACVLAMPLLTTFMNFCGLIGGFLSEYALSHLSFRLYMTRAFAGVEWQNFVHPTLKTAVFGLIIGTVSTFFGYTTDEGAIGVGRAATSSVVVSSILIIIANIILVKLIFLFFPEHAL